MAKSKRIIMKKKEDLCIAVFEEQLIDELNDLLDYVLCPSDVVETVRFFMDDYIDQEVNKRIDEIDEKIKDIYKK
tara:strand:- start:58 stop:282 length:225 start_codon:yes stop_codon:yes gene_type:complete